MSTAANLSPYGKLIRNKLVALNVPAADAEQIVGEGRLTHRTGPRKSDRKFLSIEIFRRSMFGLELAEHIARVFHNWRRCYVVDTTRLAMAARERVVA